MKETKSGVQRSSCLNRVSKKRSVKESFPSKKKSKTTDKNTGTKHGSVSARWNTKQHDQLQHNMTFNGLPSEFARVVNAFYNALASYAHFLSGFVDSPWFELHSFYHGNQTRLFQILHPN